MNKSQNKIIPIHSFIRVRSGGEMRKQNRFKKSLRKSKRQRISSDSEIESFEEELAEYRIYYIDLIRYLLYLSCFFSLMNTLNLYADDYLVEYRETHSSSMSTSAFFLLLLSLVAILCIYFFHYDGLVYKLYLFISITILFLMLRWLLAPSFLGENWSRILPFLTSIGFSGAIIFMVWANIHHSHYRFGGGKSLDLDTSRRSGKKIRKNFYDRKFRK